MTLFICNKSLLFLPGAYLLGTLCFYLFLQVRNTIQTNCICVVEVVDEGAFHLENMIQISYRDSGDVLNTIYLQAQVSDMV